MVRFHTIIVYFSNLFLLELDGNAFGTELEVLEKKKKEAMKKIIDEEIAKVRILL